MLDTCGYLAGKGFHVTYLNPGSDGIIRPEQVAEALDDDTLIVSIMHVNNETGVINDVAVALESLRRRWPGAAAAGRDGDTENKLGVKRVLVIDCDVHQGDGTA